MPIYPLPDAAKNPNNKYVIYGTGEVAKQYYEEIIRVIPDKNVICFLDTMPRSQSFMNTSVYSPTQFKEKYSIDNYYYVIASVAGANVMITNLKDIGVTENRIVIAKIENEKALRGAPFAMETFQRAVYYPPITDSVIFQEIIKKLIWYFPLFEGSVARIAIPFESEVQFPSNYSRVDIVSSNEIKDLLKHADIILVWKEEALEEEVLKSLNSKILCVDPNYYSTTESEIYRKLLYFSLNQITKDKFNSLSLNNYRSFEEQNLGKKKSHVFGTGPSIDSSFQFDFKDSLNIVCNSIVKNQELIEHIKPNLLVFADPVFHFSYCEYAAEFRKHALKLLEDKKIYCIVPEFNLPLLLAHFPELSEQLIGIASKGVAYNFPTEEQFFIRGTANILTHFMFPIASALTDDIYIIGCDGRRPNETYFWQHNASTQYGDLMQTVFEAHPSFFRDRDYEDYYEDHCKILSELIYYGESLNKHYHSLTPSYIPVLRERMVDGEND